ncbi:hypothetical protein B484DRAFT_205396 [Ochromonadaceae sp. CCMP2298]|nr:hypothetical protein B484DRAFT_205396 [Ochromonadaceae sp. CCMP2298]
MEKDIQCANSALQTQWNSGSGGVDSGEVAGKQTDRPRLPTHPRIIKSGRKDRLDERTESCRMPDWSTSLV